MAITGGFGFEFDKKTGGIRRWYCGADGVKRWADNDRPIDQQDPSKKWDEQKRCKGSGNDVDGWREGCERCQRREGNDAENVEFMEAPEIIVFECPFLIEKAEG